VKTLFFPRLLALALAGLLASTASSPAQEGGAPLKVTTTIHPDGSRTDTQKDLDARISESKTYNTSQKLVQRVVFTLDDQGRELEGTCYDAKNKITSRVSYRYDAFGFVGEVLEKAPDGTLLRRNIFHRDPNGRITGTDIFDGQGNPLNAKATPNPKKRGK